MAITPELDVVGPPVPVGASATVGEAARFAAAWYPRAVKGSDEGWTSAEIERAVVRLIEVETGIDMRRHTLDSEFVRDMGVD